MGLDMYLARRTYVKRWSHMKPEERFTISVKKGGKAYKKITPKKVSSVAEDIAYWRKANQIHKWFVENVQDGKDDCGTYEVSKEKLQELVDLCKKVLAASKMVEGEIENGRRSTPTGWEPIMEKGTYIEDPSVAQELLPTEDGFFFGSTGYDQWYVRDLEETVAMLEPVLAQDDDDFNISYEYHSSW